MSLRLLHLTDTHLNARRGETLRGVNTDATLRRVLQHVEASGQRPDAVLATGDLVHDESRAGYARLRELLLPLDAPVLCIPGNHDSPARMRNVLGRKPFRYGGVHDVGGWRIVMLSSHARGDAGGRLGRARLRRLDTALGQSRAPVLVCLHHQPIPMRSRWLDEVGLRDADRFLDVIDAHANVRAVVWGHVHQASDRRRGDVRMISTPSTCSQFRPRSDTFSMDDRPPAYRWLDLAADGRVATRLVWVDA